MILTVGKRQPISIKISGPYVDTTSTTNAFSLLHSRWTTLGGGDMHIRYGLEEELQVDEQSIWATATGTGEYGELISLTYPGGDAGAAGPLEYEAVIRATDLVWAVWP